MLAERVIRLCPKTTLTVNELMEGKTGKPPETYKADLTEIRSLLDRGVDPNAVRIAGWAPATETQGLVFTRGGPVMSRQYNMGSPGNPVPYDKPGMTLLEYCKANSLAEAVCEKNIESWVSFVGWQENPFPYYAGADVFVTASYWEGLPNTVLEAFALGTPVVATRCTSWIDEYADARACIPVEVGDVAGLAEAMARVASDHALRERLRTAGAHTIGAYRQDVVVEEREALLRGMLEARPSERGAS